MKKLILLTFAVVLVPLLTQAQDGNWTFEGVFPADSSYTGGSHAITVDGEGKVWTVDYYKRGSLRSDSSVTVHDVNVFNADGTPAEFSPVQKVTIDGETTVFDLPLGATGLATDANGDVILAISDALIRINHQTGEGMNRVYPDVDASARSAGPTVDAAGNIYITGVVGGPIVKYKPDMDTTSANGEVVIPATSSVHRNFAVSADGNSFYVPHDGANSLIVFSRPTDLSPFGEPDTVLSGWVSAASGVAVDPHSGDVWVGVYKPGGSVAYGYNAETWEQVDSVAWQIDESGLIDPANQELRAFSFGTDANTLYLSAHRHAGDNFHPIQKFTRDNPVSNEREVVSRADGYKLEQNYPNPFNPTTNINYTLKTSGQVTLKVYDMTGREVATLVNTRKNAGEYTATFDASNLASGVYLYSLETNGLRLTNRMTLIK